jgi:repressor LexA
MLSQRLAELRREREKTQEDVATHLGITRPAYTAYESGRRQPDYDALLKLASYFNVSTDYLLGHHSSNRITIPILGTIRAGIPLLAEDNWDGEIEVPAKLKAEFALRVSGDSMSWAGIHDGDTAVLKRTDSPTPGMIVAAGIEDATWDATLKYYIKDNGLAFLRAANPEYEDILFTAEHRVIGWTVAVLKAPPPYSAYKQLMMRKELRDKKWELAIEIAQQHGLDGEKVANLITLFGQTTRHLK